MNNSKWAERVIMRRWSFARRIRFLFSRFQVNWQLLRLRIRIALIKILIWLREIEEQEEETI